MTMDFLADLPWKSKSPMPTIGKDEKLLRVSHGHWMKYMAPVCSYVLLFSLCMFLFIVAVSLPSVGIGRIIFFAALTALVIIHHWFFHFILSENVSDVILTNKRILHLNRSLWFVDTMDEIILMKIKMVEVQKRGFLRRLLNYGDLWFDAGGGWTLPFIPAPKAWAEDIENNMKIF